MLYINTCLFLERKKQELQEQIQRKLREQEEILEGAKNDSGPNQDSCETTVTRRRRRHEPSSKPPLPPTEPIPVVALTNGETHFPADCVEMASIKTRLSSEKNSNPPGKIKFDFPQKKVNSPDQVITSDQKLQMDMLYGNQAIANQQAVESDECSDETNSVTDLNEKSMSVNVKALKERLQNSSSVSTPKNFNSADKTAKQVSENFSATADSLPTANKKDSDIMWERLMSQENHVSIDNKLVMFFMLVEK